MAGISITSANSQLAISVAGVFNSAVAIQQFAADNAFMQDPRTVAETVMGVDGFMSAGYTPNVVKFKITLMPNSSSKDFFDQWSQAQDTAREVMPCNAVIDIPSIGESYTLSNGVLTEDKRVPDGKKVLGAVEYTITFNTVTKAAL